MHNTRRKNKSIVVLDNIKHLLPKLKTKINTDVRTMRLNSRLAIFKETWYLLVLFEQSFPDQVWRLSCGVESWNWEGWVSTLTRKGMLHPPYRHHTGRLWTLEFSGRRSSWSPPLPPSQQDWRAPLTKSILRLFNVVNYKRFKRQNGLEKAENDITFKVDKFSCRTQWLNHIFFVLRTRFSSDYLQLIVKDINRC